MDCARSSAAADSTGTNLVAVFDGGGQVFLSADGGQTWNQIGASLGDQNWWCCAISGDGQKILIGSRSTLPSTGRLYLSSNGGASFSEVQPAGNIDLAWVAAAMDSTGQHIIVGALEDYVYTSSDYGATWTKRYPTKV